MIGDSVSQTVPYDELVIAILFPDIISVHTAINERLKPKFVWQLTSFSQSLTEAFIILNYGVIKTSNNRPLTTKDFITQS
jgi:hypothetical protein